MEDESGLELSLGLSLGGSSTSKLKVRESASDLKGDEIRTNSSRQLGTISDDSFKVFCRAGFENQEANKGKQKSNPIAQSQENFFTDLAKCSASKAYCSSNARNNLAHFTRYHEQLLISNSGNRTEEEKSSSGKRKLSFEETSFKNKHEKLTDYAEKQGAKKTPGLRNSHVSNTAEDGSAGENEEVAESEAEGPPHSWLGSQREACLPGKETGKPAFGIPSSLQPLKAMNAVPSSSSTGFPSACVMQLMPNANPVVSKASTQFAFGYPSAQLPTLETGSSWAFNSQPLQASSFTAREQLLGVQIQEQPEDGIKTSQDLAAIIGRSEGEARRRCSRMPEEVAAIRPGVSPNLRFGGCGSYPDLPWVSTTGAGPNGRTISGVTYKYNLDQVRIVCACHGAHMSPDEFVQHASTPVDAPHPSSPPPFPSPGNNTTSSAHS